MMKSLIIPTISCENCRVKKIKCNKRLYKCSNCIKNNLKCYYKKGEYISKLKNTNTIHLKKYNDIIKTKENIIVNQIELVYLQNSIDVQLNDILKVSIKFY